MLFDRWRGGGGYPARVLLTFDLWPCLSRLWHSFFSCVCHVVWGGDRGANAYKIAKFHCFMSVTFFLSPCSNVYDASDKQFCMCLSRRWRDTTKMSLTSVGVHFLPYTLQHFFSIRVSQKEKEKSSYDRMSEEKPFFLQMTYLPMSWKSWWFWWFPKILTLNRD